MTLKSGDTAGQSKTLILFLLNQFIVKTDLWHGALSCT